jgi:hypothetical protein
MHFGGMNPWLSMWTQPRKTIRSIVQENPRYGVLALAILYAIHNLFYVANLYSLGFRARPSIIFIAILLLSPVVGLLWLYFTGWIFHFTGRWLGGLASRLHLRCAIAWSQIPYVFSVAIWLILLTARFHTVFVQSASGASLIFINLMIAATLGVWSFVLLVQSIREIQGFSVARAVVNVILSGVISSIIIFTIALGIGMIVLSI